MQEAKDKRHDERMDAINDHVTEVGKNTTVNVNVHTTSESNRVIKETVNSVLSAIQQNTQALPTQIEMGTKLAGPSTTVSVLNSILVDEGMLCKGTKAEKAAILAGSVPVTKLVALLAEHAGMSSRTATPKATPKAKPKAKACPLSSDSDSDSDSDNSSEQSRGSKRQRLTSPSKETYEPEICR